MGEIETCKHCGHVGKLLNIGHDEFCTGYRDELLAEDAEPSDLKMAIDCIRELNQMLEIVLDCYENPPPIKQSFGGVKWAIEQVKKNWLKQA